MLSSISINLSGHFDIKMSTLDIKVSSISYCFDIEVSENKFFDIEVTKPRHRRSISYPILISKPDFRASISKFVNFCIGIFRYQNMTISKFKTSILKFGKVSDGGRDIATYTGRRDSRVRQAERPGPVSLPGRRRTASGLIVGFGLRVGRRRSSW